MLLIGRGLQQHCLRRIFHFQSWDDDSKRFHTGSKVSTQALLFLWLCVLGISLRCLAATFSFPLPSQIRSFVTASQSSFIIYTTLPVTSCHWSDLRFILFIDFTARRCRCLIDHCNQHFPYTVFLVWNFL